MLSAIRDKLFITLYVNSARGIVKILNIPCYVQSHTVLLLTTGAGINNYYIAIAS